MNSRSRSQNNIARWLPVGAAVGLLAAVVVAGAINGGADDGATTSVPAGTNPGDLGPAPLAGDPIVTVNPEDQVLTEAATAKVPLDRTIGLGMVGDDVTRVQQRLGELAFDPGPIDGIYGTLTRQAVWAYEKIVMGIPRDEATGNVTPELWDHMQDSTKIQPRRPTNGLADHTEIYLPEQVMIVFHGDEPELVAHISTGELIRGVDAFTPWQDTANEYCETVTIDTDDNGNVLEEAIEKAICGRSYTPPGVFEAYKKIEGRRESRLGGMYDPIYINQGIAIHGALNVPLEPASHGCIRVSQYLGGYLQSILDIGDRVLIWDGVTEPEQQSVEAMRMRWDYSDPNATTTTTSTTTTTTTTLPPATTVAPTTTTRAPSPATTSTTTTTTTIDVPSTTVVPSDDL